MQRVTITNRGLSLLASSSEATGQYYWLGYYALAYVPSIWKNEEVEFPSNGQECLNVNGEQNIESTDTDQISPAMTRLTKYGDMIYNIWQGSSAKTATANPEEPTSFYTDIKRFYRYVLDENGNNTLVAWTDVGDRDENGNPIYIGKHVYRGTDGYTKSTMYIPAPLYYLGDTYGKLATSNYFKELPSFEETSGTTGNGSDIYPYMEVTLDDGSTTLTVPEVTTDYRAYRDIAGTESSYDTYNVPSQYFNSKGILPEVTGSLDSTSWVAAKWTLTPDFNPNGDFSTVCSEFWKLWSISNYNRYNAPAGSIGTAMSSEFNTRNFSKLTKFFPIESYNVVSSQRGISASGGNVEVATALKLGISINLSSRMENDARQYDRTGMAVQHPTVLVDGTETPNDESGKNIFDSTHVSFKFNRIGIYAVPVMKAPVVNGKGAGEIAGKNVTLQYQIDPDGEPVLFAVIDWDNTITLSDAGDGIHEFEAEFNVNLEAPDGSVDSSIVRDTSIFYNIYQTPELKWYQNQLIATASTANAITEMGLELAAMRTRMDALSTVCCALPEKSDEGNGGSGGGYGLRNLKDAANAIDGGLRGVDTLEENDDYAVGIDSIALGTATGAAGKASSVLGGKDNYIGKTSVNSTISGGTNNIISNSYNLFEYVDCSIIGGSENSITSCSAPNDSSENLNIIGSKLGHFEGPGKNSSIISGYFSTISNANSDFILGTGRGTIINGKVPYSIEGYDAVNTNSNSIVGGYDNTITTTYNSNYGYVFSSIFGGHENTINATGAESHRKFSTIIGGHKNTITGAEHSAIIGSSGSTILGNGVNLTIIGGFGIENDYYENANAIATNGSHNGIFSGGGNTIKESTNKQTNYSSVFGGHLNVLNGASYSSIVGGYNNYIGYSDLESSVGCAVIGGYTNYIYEGSCNLVGSSSAAHVWGNNITVLSSNGCNVYGDNSAVIGANTSNIYGEVKNSIIAGGFLNNQIIGPELGFISSCAIIASEGSTVGGEQVNVSSRSSIISGYNCSITGSAMPSTIIGSNNCSVHGAPASTSFIANSWSSEVTNSILTSIINSNTCVVDAGGSLNFIIGSSASTISKESSVSNYSSIIGSGNSSVSGAHSMVINSESVNLRDGFSMAYLGRVPTNCTNYVSESYSSVYEFSGSGNIMASTNYCYSDIDLTVFGSKLLKLDPNSIYSCVATFTGGFCAAAGNKIAKGGMHTAGCSTLDNQGSYNKSLTIAYTKIFAFTITTDEDGNISMTCSEFGENPQEQGGANSRRVYKNNTLTFTRNDDSPVEEGRLLYTATMGSLIYAGLSGWTLISDYDDNVKGWEKGIYVDTYAANHMDEAGADTSIGFHARLYFPRDNSLPIGDTGNKSVARVKLECEKMLLKPQS